MSWRFCTLVRKDHDDLDLALVAMLATATPIGELAPLYGVLRLAFPVHAHAETRALRALCAKRADCPMIHMVMSRTDEEHQIQRAQLVALGDCRPGSDRWYERVLELRITMLDHASRAELVRWTIDDHATAAERSDLAARYAAERIRMLGRTAPTALVEAAV